MLLAESSIHEFLSEILVCVGDQVQQYNICINNEYTVVVDRCIFL